MEKLFSRRMIAWVLTLCLLTGCVTLASASDTQAPEAAPTAAQSTAQLSDFDALKPIMDLVGSAAENAGDQPEVIGNEETTLTAAFISAFFNNGLTADATLGITADMLANTDQQAACLSKIFAAKLPTLETIAQTTPINGYIGFQPVTVNAGSDSDVQIIGELYWGAKAMSQMSDADYRDIQWLDRAVYSFRADSNATYGYLLTGFSVGSELDMEDAMQDYTDSILVEYINSALGFSVLYPSVFTDDMLMEDGEGVSASLPDNSLRFFVKRIENAENINLADYVDEISKGIANAKSNLNTTFSYATVAYETEGGYSVFDVYIVTEKYIYEAELSYKKELASKYQMYTSYLENSFSVDEVSVG